MAQPIVVTDHSTRPELEAAIAALRAKAKRLPAAWVDERTEIATEVDNLIEQWRRTPA